MLTIILVVLGLNLLVAVVILIVLLLRKRENPALTEALSRIAGTLETFERNQKDDMQRLRTDLLNLETDTRRELTASLALQKDSIATESRNNREETTAALAKLNQQSNADATKNREELNKALNDLSESLTRKLQELTGMQQTQSEGLKTALEARMEQIRANNESKLEEMRKTVDEKLHDTLEKRLGESFQLVSQRLEQVHKGLGEMQSLANGVGDLKKVLVNVKSRGVMGEIQLENILEQTLSAGQYVKNFKPHKRRDDVVEFAIQLPGRTDDPESLYLPVDAKFPIEDYHRLVDAFELGDLPAVEAARKNLQTRIRGCAKDIHDKYINPPLTTDFALLFLPFEGLFAEVMRDAELFEVVRRQYQVIIVGPTTISALLNSLQMGFRTLAIEKRTSEVWNILGAVKSEFSKFGLVLEKTQKKLQEASNVIDSAHNRSRQIQRKLNKVQDLPAGESAQILEIEDDPEFTQDEVSDE